MNILNNLPCSKIPIATQNKKGLMSNQDKTKLDGIESNANNYTHPNDPETRHVSDQQILEWNNKAEKTTASTDANGLMSSTDKVKLDGIEEGANKYVHPASHSASMIDEDSTHRFVSDSEKTTWNNKAEKTEATKGASGLMSAADKTKLDGITPGANNYVHPDSHPASMITEDGTHRFVSDSDKATWNSKAPNTLASISTNGLMAAADKSKLDSIEEGANKYVHPNDENTRHVTDAEKAKWNTPPTKTTVGLSNVTNDAQVKRSEMGTVNGVATLDDTGKVPSAQLPGFVDEVLEAETKDAFPETGESGKIYVDTTENKTYRWSGTQYVEISPSIALGETSATAYAGDKGKAVTDEVNKIKDGTTVVPKANDANTVSGFTVKTNVPSDAKFTDTTYSKASIYTDGLMSKEDKSKLDGVEANANYYVHPNDINTMHVSSTEKATWNAKASTAVVTTEANGLMSKEDKTKLDGVEANANNYSHPSSHPASMITEDTTHKFVSDSEKATWNAKASTAVVTTRVNGLMSAADKTKLDGLNNYTHPETHPASMITEDGTRRFVSDSEKATWNAKASTAVATTGANGLMSKEDKSKLDGIAANANNYVHPNDANTRHVTDTQISTWNAKLGKSVQGYAGSVLSMTDYSVNTGNIYTSVASGSTKLSNCNKALAKIYIMDSAQAIIGYGEFLFSNTELTNKQVIVAFNGTVLDFISVSMTGTAGSALQFAFESVTQNIESKVKVVIDLLP